MRSGIVNELALHLHVEPLGYAFSDNGPPELYFQATIDGECPARFPIVVSPKALVKSIERDGEQFIFTCACGYHECANITTGVTVSHGAGIVRWVSPVPVGVDTTFEFESYARAIREGMDRTTDLLDSESTMQGWKPPGYLRKLQA